MTSSLRGKSVAELQTLAEELRQVIISTCMKNGGHLGASLGAVEIAIALHAIFESPAEPIVWDVGHQAYAHKLLTGRHDRFGTLRQKGGLSGFLSRSESEHDVFGAGHSSTSLSAALGMAWARREQSGWTVAVIGDGALSAGISFEALNHFRAIGNGRLLIVLNDNHMSISENVGRLNQVFSQGQARQFFELMGLEYVGPVDGHDLDALTRTLADIRGGSHDRPVVLHAMTQKGRGYGPAEEKPTAFHGVGGSAARESSGVKKARSYSEALGDALCSVASQDSRVVAITAAMTEGTGLYQFSQRFADRFFDVGIAEPHAVTFAAGLATQGLRPVVAIYSTFLQRSLDQIIHDVALQGLPVIFAVDRAGLVGADGPTHHGVFDLVYAGMVPGLTVVAPTCLEEVEAELKLALARSGPTFIRYPRGSGSEHFSGPQVDGLRSHSSPDRAECLMVALGAAADKAQALVPLVGDSVELISTSLAKPFAPALIARLKAYPDVELITLEDGVTRGGFGEALAAELGPRSAAIHHWGVQDLFVPHGTPAQLDEDLGLSPARLAARLKALTRSKVQA